MKNFPKTLLTLLALYLGILVFAGLVTPVAFNITQDFWPRFGAEKIFDRMRYVGLLLALPILWRGAGLKTFRELGWGKWRTGVALFFLGVGSAVILEGWLTGGFAGVTLPAAGKLWLLVGRGLLAGVCVAVVEEVVFRGLLQRRLSKPFDCSHTRACGFDKLTTFGSGSSTSMPNWLEWKSLRGALFGIFLASLIYSWLHGRPSLEGLSLAGAGGVSWGDSLTLAWRTISQWPQNFPLGAFVNLTLLGAALGIFYHKSRSLLPPIGLHAGIVAAAIPLSAVTAQTGLSGFYLVGSWQATVVLGAWVVGALFSCTGRRP